MQNSVRLSLVSPQKTCDLAQRFARKLGNGNVVLLHGGIGAGKTHFARCVIQSVLLTPEDIPSPTFTLVQTYDTRIGEIWHADLYRLGHPDDVVELGLFDAFSDAICLIEWPDRLGTMAPKSALNMYFDLGGTDDSRIITLKWSDPVWNEILKDLLNDG